MRKQTKIAVVSAAAALLAIGGAMTSFAAQGWVEEDGTWYYYDKDGNRVENEWKKSGPLIMFTAYWYIEYYVRLNHSVSGRLLGHTLSLSTPYYSSINIYTGIRVYLAP